MPISERLLRSWRKEALESPASFFHHDESKESLFLLLKEIQKLSTRILRLTQELLDQHLLRK